MTSLLQCSLYTVLTVIYHVSLFRLHSHIIDHYPERPKLPGSAHCRLNATAVEVGRLIFVGWTRLTAAYYQNDASILGFLDICSIKTVLTLTRQC